MWAEAAEMADKFPRRGILRPMAVSSFPAVIGNLSGRLRASDSAAGDNRRVAFIAIFISAPR